MKLNRNCRNKIKKNTGNHSRRGRDDTNVKERLFVLVM
jgi:hypothetical protein